MSYVPTRRQRDKIWPLVVATAVWLLLLAPITIFCTMTGLLADGSGGAESITLVVRLFLAWPILIVVGLVAAWFAYWRNFRRTSWALIVTPALWPIVPLSAGTLLLPHFWTAS